MRRSLALITVAMFAGAIGGTALGGRVLTATNKATEVSEQNLDANGYIRVHEQGTATVAVANFPATQNVAVTNLPAVQNVRLAGREPFTAGESFLAKPIPDGDVGGSDTFVVPAARRLVIDYVSAYVFLPVGQNPLFFIVEASQGGRFVATGSRRNQLSRRATSRLRRM